MLRAFCPLAFLVVTLTACPPVGPNGRDVGAPCDSDRDCTDQCAEQKEFDDGMCTIECDDDHDCPDGTVCILNGGGVCAISCDRDSDCDGFAQKFECKETVTPNFEREEVCLAD